MEKYAEVRDRLVERQFSWLVTGASGFIGSNLVEALLVLKQRVVGLDNFETGYQRNIDQAVEDAAIAMDRNVDEVKDNFLFIRGDINELEDCRRACEGVDFVLHQAALGSVPRSVEDPIKTNRANVDGFLNMLVAARDEKVTRFVYAASSATYGDHQRLPKVEKEIGNLLSPYAVTKRVNELYAQVFSLVYGFKTIGLRYFNIFGKRQDPNGAYAAVIPKWVMTLLKDQDVSIYGDGETSRDFCYVENAVQANILAATTTNEDAIGEIYNIAVHERTSLNRLYELIEQKISEKTGHLISRKPIFKERRPGDVQHSLADIKKAGRLLSYVPTHRVGDGLDETIDWYLRMME